MFIDRPLILSAACGLWIFASPAPAQDFPVNVDDFASERVYSPYVDRTFPDQVYFGDTHLHTTYSPDAGLVGTTLDPEQAYRFARGEEVTSNTGQRCG